MNMQSAVVVQLVAVAVFMLSTVKLTSALKCYQCDNLITPECGDGAFDSTKLDTCDNGNSCSKFKGTYNDAEYVHRTCNNPAVTEDTCESASEDFDNGDTVTGDVCVCDSEMCNSAPQFAGSIFLVATALGTALNILA